MASEFLPREKVIVSVKGRSEYSEPAVYKSNGRDPEDLPLARALAQRTPSQGTLFIRGLDGVSRHLSVTAVPLEGQGGTNLGAMAIFSALPRR